MIGLFSVGIQTITFSNNLKWLNRIILEEII